MKTLFTTLLVLLSFVAIAQNDEVNLPLKDNVITYEGIVEVDPSKSKDVLYKAARQWFADTYVNADAVIQMEDKAEGKLIGKGVYNYSFINGVNVSEITLHFTLNIDIKDGKYRYRLYNFSGVNKNTSMLSSTAGPSVSQINYDAEYKALKEGSRVKYRTKLLSGLDAQAQGIILALNEAMKKAESSEEW